MVMQGDNHMGKFLQLKHQLLKERKCKGGKKKGKKKRISRYLFMSAIDKTVGFFFPAAVRQDVQQQLLE